MIKTILKTILIVLIGLAIFATNVLAVPGMSHKFYGSVTLNGQSAPDGTTVTAKINDVTVATTTTSEGKYGYPLYFFGVDDPDNNRAGKQIKFFVNNIDTGQIVTFCNACYNLCDMYTPDCAPLDLSVSSGTSPPPSGGGVYVPPTEEEEEEEVIEGAACQEEWICSEWSVCENGIQTRTCEDVNNCGTRINEPFLTQPCSAEEREEGVPSPLGITGFFLGVPTSNWIAGIGGGVIVAVIIIFLLTRRTKKKR